jgi:predicted nuclease of predicted toxin-antitoxin system
MKFVADENLDFPIVQLLRANNFEVLYILESHSGIEDDEVLTISNNKKAILITQDKDFGELVYRLKRIHSGVILVRLEGKIPAEKAKIVLSVIEKYHSKLQNSFSVVYEDFVKIRN